jgi:flagellar basal body-associated protein FliL
MSDKAKAKEPEKAITPDGAESSEAAPPKRASGLMTIVKAIAFVSIIVIVQVVGAAIFIPSAQDTEKLARQYIAAAEGEAAAEGAHEGEAHGEEHAGEEVTEIELGTFNITHFNPGTNSTLSIDFELFATVLAADATEFEHLFEKNKVRVREQVIMTLHAAQSKDLSDAGLGLIKRQILEKTNRALGHPMVREVLFSKFNFVER